MTEISSRVADRHDAKFFAAIDCWWAGLDNTKNLFADERRSYWQSRLAQGRERGEDAFVALQAGCYYAGFLVVRETEGTPLVDLAVNPRFQATLGKLVITELLRSARLPNPFAELAVIEMPTLISTSSEHPAILASA